MNIIEEKYDWAYSLSSRSSTSNFILHHAAIATASAQDIHRIHRYSNGWNGIGYHYYVRKNGSVYRGRPEYALGGHTEGMNSSSIGACFEGNFETEYMSPAQLEAGKQLVAYIRSRYPSIRVTRHRDHNATACPGRNFPYSQMLTVSVTPPPVIPQEKDVTWSEVQAMINAAKSPIYNTLNDIPDWGRPTVAKLVNKGLIQGDGNGLNISDTMLRIVVLNDRAGLYN